MHEYMHVCAWLYMYVCAWLYMYVCAWLCMYMQAYIHEYTCKSVVCIHVHILYQDNNSFKDNY